MMRLPLLVPPYLDSLINLRNERCSLIKETSSSYSLAEGAFSAEVANPELPLKLKEDEEELENSIEYQTSVAGGMGTDAENAPSAKEYEDKTSLIKEHRSFRKFIKESK